MAGYQGANGSRSGAGIGGATSAAFQFTYVSDNDGIDNNGDDVTDEFNELTTIGYTIYDDNADGTIDDIGRSSGGVSLVAENIQKYNYHHRLLNPLKIEFYSFYYYPNFHLPLSLNYLFLF